jgi:NAD(P)-dependent dehydrogenase (short-subunit alcohol dehydrogenase family)
MRALKRSVAVVAGAMRGAGRGIACMLGEAGATIYCTGRSVRGKPSTPGRLETIDETAEMVAARGGIAIPVQMDHTVRDPARRRPDLPSSQAQRPPCPGDLAHGMRRSHPVRVQATRAIAT